MHHSALAAKVLAALLRGPKSKLLNGVYELLTACFLVVAGTLKLHIVVVIKMAPTSTSTMKLDSQKAKEWGGAICQGHSFNPSHVA